MKKQFQIKKSHQLYFTSISANSELEAIKIFCISHNVDDSDIEVRN